MFKCFTQAVMWLEWEGVGFRPDTMSLCSRQRTHLEQQRRQLVWDERSQAAERHGLLLERQQARLSRQLRRALDRANAQLAREQRAQYGPSPALGSVVIRTRQHVHGKQSFQD